jgi:isopentenyldiphosphate isomerase
LASDNEVVEVVDEDNRLVDVAPRRVVRAHNLVHRTITVACRNGAGEAMVRRRTRSKDIYPGVYDVLVGGVVRAEESYEQAAVREPGEELGIVGVTPSFLFLHRYLGPLKRCWIAAYEIGWWTFGRRAT